MSADFDKAADYALKLDELAQMLEEKTIDFDTFIKQSKKINDELAKLLKESESDK